MKTLNINEVFFKRGAIIFFVCFFICGCLIFKDYGLSVDEAVQRTIGEVNYNFIKSGDSKELLALGDYGEGKYHGPAFEIFLYSAEKLLNLKDSRDIFLMRHGLNFLLFFIGVLIFYLLGLKIFKSHGAALLSAVMLVISPRIFAESFYNSKDLPMLCFCIFACYTTLLFVERQTIRWAIINAAFCGFAMDIRIMALLLPFGALYLYLMQKHKKIVPLLMFISCTLLFTMAFWPVLWIDPEYHFIAAFKQMSHFTLSVDTLYMGRIVSGPNLPWHYLPVWILCTTPISYMVLLLVGLFFALKNSFVNFKSTLPIQLFIYMLVTPILAVIILHSTVYDSWRHVYFVYPFFLLIAVYGFTQLINAVKNRLAVRIISFSTVISVIFVLIFMISNHPFQNLYFNSFAGKNIRQNYEMDYWGLSFKQGLEHILANDKSGNINIASDMGVCFLNFDIIPIENRKRLNQTDDLKSANYFLTAFRLYPNGFNFGTAVFQIKVGNEVFMEVRKLN